MTVSQTKLNDNELIESFESDFIDFILEYEALYGDKGLDVLNEDDLSNYLSKIIEIVSQFE